MKTAIIICALIALATALDSSDSTAIEDAINQYRSIVYPLAKRMTCLIWDSVFEEDAKKIASSCKLPNSKDESLAVSVDKGDAKYLAVFAEWLGQNANYQFENNTCASRKSCVEFKTAFNDLANEFACSQAKCDSVGSDFPKADEAYTYTVCKFDKPRQKGKPYSRSDSTEFSCSATSCPAGKSLCVNNLCCTGLGSGDCEDTVLDNVCTETLCQQLPGRYLSQCRKTCNNCDGCKCQDTNFKVSGFHCGAAVAANSTYCLGVEAKEFCPATCNMCNLPSYCARKGSRGI